MNYHTDEWIMERVKKHYDRLLEEVQDSRFIFGVFVYGSQNYGMDTENSDIDTKALIFPSIEDLVFNRKPVSTTIHIGEEDQMDVKDIREYFSLFKKHNLNFTEIMFTKYYIINPIYADYWEQFCMNREIIARGNPYLLYMSIFGQMKRYSDKIINKETGEIHAKNLKKILRFADFIDQFSMGELYEDCLLPQKLTRYMIEEINKGDIGSPAAVQVQIDNSIDTVLNTEEKMKALTFNRNIERTNLMIDDALLNIMVYHMYTAL